VRYFVVAREPGAAWDHSRPMREQEDWDGHAAFMDSLAEDGFIVLGGPLGDGSQFMHVVDAEGEEEIEARLAADPWTPMQLVRTRSIEPWEILLARVPPA
jgi:uncharacterized protein YciI